jgi:hypothetical protein
MGVRPKWQSPKAITMMHIRINAKVECVDGLCGRCAHIILNPWSIQVTHLVVMVDALPHTQYLVPINQVAYSESNIIHLRCQGAALAGMEDFVERESVQMNVPPAYWPGEYTMEPLYISSTAEMAIEHLRIPPGEIDLHRGVRVLAVDGPVGQVDEFLLDSEGGHITHLVLLEGHLLDKHQSKIPSWLIEQIEDDAVYLKLTKRFLGALPSTSLRREREEKR